MPTNYLDVVELAEVLGLSVATIRRRLRCRAWELPPKAHGFEELLRWRRAEVVCWVAETEYRAGRNR